MCGICGYLGELGDGALGDGALLERMTASLVHRGPDDGGTFREGEVGLGHRRLSVIDLSGGHQPMTSSDGALVIVFNGEIYNYRELRAELTAAGQTLRTESDTEVLLELYRRDGERALERLNGMFALAIYDRGREELFLARDRVGIKPLYYVETAAGLLFASETKALLQAEGWDRSVHAPSVLDALALRYVPGDRPLFRDVRRLAPGHWARYRRGQLTLGRYWSPPAPDAGGAAAPRSEGEWLEAFGSLLETCVRRRLVSDVSFGAYLSGGLDSSVIVALMSRLVSAPVKTFSVGFDYEHDELGEARATAERLGCQHREIACRAEDVALLPEVVYHSDEPLGDPIAIPMYLLAREAKKDVTVILTGEGADEILAGYLFHKVLWAGEEYRRHVPRALRRGLVRPVLGALPAWALNLAFRYPAYLGDRGKWKALDYLDIVEDGGVERGYRHLISLFDGRDTGTLFTPEFEERLREEQATGGEGESTGSGFDHMLRLQFDHWLPDNMLLRQDKMGMASAIEGRVPYLDHELIELAFRLPRRLRLRGWTGKYALRRLAEDLLPRANARRRKMPFYVPIENFFEEPAFVDMADDLLSEESVRRRGIFRPQAVARLRSAMQKREFLLVKQIFALMTLELWYRTFVDAPARVVS